MDDKQFRALLAMMVFLHDENAMVDDAIFVADEIIEEAQDRPLGAEPDTKEFLDRLLKRRSAEPSEAD